MVADSPLGLRISSGLEVQSRCAKSRYRNGAVGPPADHADVHAGSCRSDAGVHRKTSPYSYRKLGTDITERVTLTREENGVADVRFARPDKLNALDQEQFEAINAMIDRLAKKKAVRCVVLSGGPGGFVPVSILTAFPAIRRSAT